MCLDLLELKEGGAMLKRKDKLGELLIKAEEHERSLIASALDSQGVYKLLPKDGSHAICVQNINTGQMLFDAEANEVVDSAFRQSQPRSTDRDEMNARIADRQFQELNFSQRPEFLPFPRQEGSMNRDEMNARIARRQFE